MTLSRKEFLRRGLFSLGELLYTSPRAAPDHTERHPVRPPGMQPGRGTECGECDRCVQACPEGIVRRPDGQGGPVLDFAETGCRFCYLCIGSCPSGVLSFPVEGEQPRLGQARLNEGCIAGGCFTCSERCPYGAVTIAWGAGVTIDAERCTGCGTCESSCPVRPTAIMVMPLPDKKTL